MKAQLTIGRVRSAFGRAGEIKIESLSGETGHFLVLDELMLVRRETVRTYKVESIRTNGGQLVAKLEGVDSPEAARLLAGWEIVAPRDLAAVLQDGEYYFADLHGLQVTHQGGPVGSVAAIWEAASRTFLEVRTRDGAPHLVPFEEAFIVRVDLAQGVIELRTRAVLE